MIRMAYYSLQRSLIGFWIFSIRWARVPLALALLFCATSSVMRADQPTCTVHSDPDRASLSAAVDAASDGDVICLNAGTATYTSLLDVTGGGTKALEIRGAGTIPSVGSAGSTIIYSQTGDAFQIVEVAGSSHYPTVDNIKFTVDGSSETDAFVIHMYNPGVGVSGKPPIIHHNDFSVSGTCDHHMIGMANEHAVIYRNKFTTAVCAAGYTNLIALHVQWDDFTDDSKERWETTANFGSADTNGDGPLYFETNYLSGFLASDFSTDSRAVVRFNELHNSSFGGHGSDSGPTNPGMRYNEFYNNSFDCTDTIGSPIPMSNYLGIRGGTGFIINNTFGAFSDNCRLNLGPAAAAVVLPYYRSVNCTGIEGWPGSYPDTYPAAHLPGWGWISGANQTVGDSSHQNIPGGAGFQQALQPWYIAANTNNSAADVFVSTSQGSPECQAMAYSSTGKGGGADTHLVIPDPGAPFTTGGPYWNVGQDAVVVFSDLVGGSTPTIADSLGNSWSAIQGGTNGSLRLTAWHSRITVGGQPVITITFGSSSAARAGSLTVMRGLESSGPDANPAVNSAANTNPYLGPSSGSLAQTNEIVLGYFALNGPLTTQSYTVTAGSISGGTGYSDHSCGSAVATTGGTGTGLTVQITQSGGVVNSVETCSAGSGYIVGDVITITGGGGNATFSVTATGDAVSASSPDNLALSAPIFYSNNYTGLNGTSGGTAASNALVGVTYRVVTSASAIQPQLHDATDRNGITGTVSFKVSSNDVGNLNLTGFMIQNDREIYQDNAGFTGSSGTGYGVRASRPPNCTTGVAYWSTDQGSWNTSPSGGQGVLDKCTGTNTWTDAWYVPYTYPNPLANVTGSDGSSSFGQRFTMAIFLLLMFGSAVYRSQTFSAIASHEQLRQEKVYVEIRRG